jgi:serine/threonine protein kinase
VKDYFIIPGQGQYLVMDFVEGEDLGQMVERVGGPLPEAQVLDWAEQLCDALVYLHNQDPPIIHRDIKPANIKLTPSGKVMLVDFGIAKVYDPNVETTMGAKAITPGYSPPEQYGLGATDARSDLDALGATLYDLLTGQPPPPSVNALMGGTAAPAAVQTLNPAVSPRVSAAIERAMQLKLEQRFGSATEMKAALRPPASQPAGPHYPVLQPSAPKQPLSSPQQSAFTIQTGADRGVPSAPVYPSSAQLLADERHTAEPAGWKAIQEDNAGEIEKLKIALGMIGAAAGWFYWSVSNGFAGRAGGANYNRHAGETVGVTAAPADATVRGRCP